ncbi:MAG: ATP-dependent DNA helicase [Endomicrobiales bacterium]
MRTGDLVSGFTFGVRASDGIRFHQALQKANRERYAGEAEYLSEVPLSLAVETEELVLEVGGRVDGIVLSEGGVTIEEIKTTAEDLDAFTEETNPLHWAQARCYAHLYAAAHGGEKLLVRLTYFQVDTRRTRSFEKLFSAVELREFFDRLVEKYLGWAKTLRDWAEVRDRSIRALEFPYPAYRVGQREFAVEVYKAIRDGKRIFAQAPTGTGKTMAALFPAVKSAGEGHTAKLFYLTAKTSTRAIAEKAFDAMRARGLRFKTVTITAKEKTCFSPGAACGPEECPFAKGYYDRVGEALQEIFARDALTRPAVEDCARAHRLCPFEFSLDLSLWMDGIICDYNYVFDPRVYLRRFFEDDGEAGSPGNYTFLIDEAHNLVDRSREMFSAALGKEAVLGLKQALKGGRKKRAPGLKKLHDALEEVNDWFIEARKTCEPLERYGRAEGFRVQKEAPEGLYLPLREFLRAAEKLLAARAEYPFREALLQQYFEVHRFLRTSEDYDERYVTWFERRGNDVIAKLFCIDPSSLLASALKRGNAAAFFSATLAPLEYFNKVLGGDEDSPRLRLPSPFPKENLLVLLDDRVSTTYRERPFTYGRVSEGIASLAGGKTGNYLVFFPSYAYMKEVCRLFREQNPHLDVVAQKEGMTEAEREGFLERFAGGRDKTLVGFAVMGGIFGEGIDLIGDRLSGVVIVGVGLPQISLERDIIQEYYRETLGLGFEYAYVFPGMNKVLQAVGRLIRSETDRGAALLLDERFARPLYRSLMPPEWLPLEKMRGSAHAAQVIKDFWEGKKTRRA